MAFAGFVFIGILFGIALAAIVGVFIVLRIGGPLQEKLLGDAIPIPGRAAGLVGQAVAPPAPGSVESAQRVKSLQEELRITQRLVEQGRTEYKAQAEELRKATEDGAAARVGVQERDERLAALQASLHKERAEMDELRQELADREDVLMRTSMQLRDIETERGVESAGANVFVDQVSRLQQERDEFAARVQSLEAQLVGRAGNRDLLVDC